MHISLYPFILLKNKPSSFSPWFIVRCLLPHSRPVLPLCNKLFFLVDIFCLKCMLLSQPGTSFVFPLLHLKNCHLPFILLSLVLLEALSGAPQLIILPCACSRHNTYYAMFYLQMASPARKLFECIHVYPALCTGFCTR